MRDRNSSRAGSGRDQNLVAGEVLFAREDRRSPARVSARARLPAASSTTAKARRAI